MDYKKVEIDIYETKPVFAGACGEYNSVLCGASAHHSGARGACGDYNSVLCETQVHRSGALGACGDYNSVLCEAKVHRQ